MKNLRLNLLLLLFFFLGAAIIGRLIFIQIIRKDFYKALAFGQQQFSVQVQQKRGEIFIKNGKDQLPLAVNKTWPFCYIVPREIKESEKVAKILSNILNINENEILEKINNKDSLFAQIKSKLTPTEVTELKKINLRGIYLGEEILRYYPQEKFASQLIGFLKF